MTENSTQRWVMALIPIGVAFLMASIFLPVQFAAFTWMLSVVSFIAALICAIIVRRRRKAEQTAVQQGGSR